ncbi:MAG: sulfatase [Flavobacteriaceae bacterium]|nr:sulfatase [Flavobacteriaceae bacterium]MDG2314035.1 sulfatase [Flavobacteriaceae bacterium]
MIKWCSIFCFYSILSFAQSHPNILIIHVDDLGYHDLSIHGSKTYHTPHIDKLATQSVSFTEAYANYPRCVPSRFSLMTGSYPIQNGNVPDAGFQIKNIAVNKNFIKSFNKLGYQTAYFGKWHLGDEQSLLDFGFQFSFGAGKAGSPISFFYPFNVFKGKGKNKKKPIPDIDDISNQGDYLTDVMTNQTLNYLYERDLSKPFMLMLSYYAVHQPLEAKQEDVERNSLEIDTIDFGNQPEFIKEGTGRTKMRQDNPTYAAMVENLDKNVGKIIVHLQSSGILENTIIVFSSDHGGLSNDGYNKRKLATSNFPLRAGKGWLYEGGIKVPLFIKWQNQFKPRIENKSIVTLMDIFPTLLELTAQVDLNVDGKSMAPVLYSKKKWQNRSIYWHSDKARPKNTGDTKSSAIRRGKYKLIHWFESNRVELYNLKKDPIESINLANQKPKLKLDLLTELNTWKSKMEQ